MGGFPGCDPVSEGPKAMHDDATESRIIDLLLRWERLHALGRAPAPEELAADSPELAAELGRRIAALRAMDAVLGDRPATPAAADTATLPVLASEPARAKPPPGEFLAVSRMVAPRFLARGGLGEVVVVHQEELDRPVALKRIRPDRLHDTARKRFLREAAITARLQHPGIVPIYGVGEDGDGPFYTMPFLHGETLKEAVRRFHQDPTVGRDRARQALELSGLLRRYLAVCETVAYAHDQGVIHRDLKPSNVMLGSYGETLVLDWGLAKRFSGDPVGGGAEAEEDGDRPEASPDDMTATGAVMGTPQYMSPEQAAGRPAGPASDLYSLGAILYAILTGKSPYEESPPDDPLRPVRAAMMVPPRRRNPDAPAPWRPSA